MAKSRPLTIRFPSGGVSKRYGYHQQAPFTTPSADNVWPSEWETGRERGGVRPGLSYFPGPGAPTAIGAPYNWCEANWVNNIGVAVTSANGTYVSTGGAWSEYITTNPGTDFSSCAVYLQTLYQARGNGTCLYETLAGGGGSGTALSNAGGGTAPTNCGIVVAWGDRLVLAGDTSDPQIIYMSAVGDATDWDFSLDTASAAWANSGGTSGHIGENITSLIPHNNDCLLVGGTDSIYAVRGNPRLSTTPVYTLSNAVGPLMQSAWCKTGNDFTMMMTRDGLYSMRPGCGEPPVSISRENLPEDLTAIDPGSGDKVSLGYDSRWRGLHIYVNRSGGTDTHWFYDLQSKGFWPMSFDAGTMDLAVNFKKESSSTKSGLIALTTTGVGYQFDIESDEEIASHLYYGPIAIGTPHTEGIVSEITAVLGEASEPVAWELYTADSPQQAFNLAEPTFSGNNWEIQGLNYIQNPLVRGSALYLKASGVNSGAGDGRWTIEEIPMVVRQAGRRRVN